MDGSCGGRASGGMKSTVDTWALRSSMTVKGSCKTPVGGGSIGYFHLMRWETHGSMFLRKMETDV